MEHNSNLFGTGPKALDAQNVLQSSSTIGVEVMPLSLRSLPFTSLASQALQDVTLLRVSSTAPSDYDHSKEATTPPHRMGLSFLLSLKSRTPLRCSGRSQNRSRI